MTITADTVHAERAWRGFDRITAADETPDPALGWDQTRYRTACGTDCCYAGHLAIDNGGIWLVTINDKSEMFIDGMRIDPGAADTEHEVWEYMLAEPNDPERAIEEAYGKRVIHVAARADRLLGLVTINHDLFYSNNTRPDLERLITRHFGPRAIHVGGTANRD
jgi:hypothetical protein